MTRFKQRTVRAFFNIFSASVLVSLFSLFFSYSPASAETLRGMTGGGYLTSQDISDFASWKGNVIRYNLYWGEAGTSNPTTYRAWLAQALAEFDLLLPSFKANGVKVVLTLHSPPGGFSRTDSKATHRIFTDAWAQDELLVTWQTIATRYVNEPGIWGYYLVNEPAQYYTPSPPLKNWNQLAAELVGIVRGIDPTKKLLVAPPYASRTRLKGFKKISGSDIVYTFHNYEPFKFTHQGLSGMKSNIKYPSKKNNAASLKKNMQSIRRFQKKSKGQIFLAEFTVARWAPKGSGAKYLKDLIRLFEKYHWSWTYHGFREASVWSVEYPSNKDPNPSPVDTDRKKVLLKYFAKN